LNDSEDVEEDALKENI